MEIPILFHLPGSHGCHGMVWEGHPSGPTLSAGDVGTRSSWAPADVGWCLAALCRSPLHPEVQRTY